MKQNTPIDHKYEIQKSLMKVHSFSNEQINALVEKGKDRTLEKGEYLLQAGRRCDFLAFIHKGSLRFFSTADTDELTLHFFVESSWVTNYESLISQTPSKSCLQAMETTELKIVFLNDLHKLLEQYPEFRYLLKVLDQSIISSSHLKSIVISPPDERYRLLLNDHPEWINRFPQMYIASYLGMTKETFSRVKARVR